MADSPAARPLLQVEGLTTVFPVAGRERPAAQDVSLSIAPGETLALVGESGSGKSVTALSIVRLVPPPGRIAAGRVLFDGQDLASLDDAGLCRVRGRRIGFVFQEPMVALDPVYTIGAQITETLRAHGLATGSAARQRVHDLLEAVRMPDPAARARQYPHQLSGGLRQRAMIALALCAEPSLLIADEPTTALDVTVQAEILELLRDLRRMFDLSVLLVSHDVGVVAEMADRVAVMYAGRIVEQAPVAAIFDEPAHPYTRALLAALPGGEAGRPLQSIPGNVPALGRAPAGCGFAPRCANRFAPCDSAPGISAVGANHDVRCFLHGTATS